MRWKKPTAPGRHASRSRYNLEGVDGDESLDGIQDSDAAFQRAGELDRYARLKLCQFELQEAFVMFEKSTSG